MKSLSHLVTTFGIVQIFLITSGFLITRTLLKARTKTIDPDLLHLKPVHWLSNLTSSYGPLLLLLPLTWCALVLWWGRNELTNFPQNANIFRLGLATTFTIAGLCSLSVLFAIGSLFGPIAHL